jgi:hypothetical protein
MSFAKNQQSRKEHISGEEKIPRNNGEEQAVDQETATAKELCGADRADA